MEKRNKTRSIDALIGAFSFSKRLRWVLGQVIKPSEEISEEEIGEIARKILTEEIECYLILSVVNERGPLTIPEISNATQLPLKRIVRHIIDMRKMGIVTEVGEKDDYYLYGAVQTKR